MSENKQLTNADLAEIKKRVDKVLGGNILTSLSALQANNKVLLVDVPALIAEIGRLQSEVKRLTDGIDCALYDLHNEDVSNNEVVEEIAEGLRLVYNGERPENFNPFYKFGGRNA